MSSDSETVMSNTEATLDKNTRLTVAAAVTAIGLAISATWWVAHQLGAIRQELKDLKSASSSAMTVAAASEQALREAIENPGHRVPDPRDPNRIIVVVAGKVTTGQ